MASFCKQAAFVSQCLVSDRPNFVVHARTSGIGGSVFVRVRISAQQHLSAIPLRACDWQRRNREGDTS
jgi:hypothetical protein